METKSRKLIDANEAASLLNVRRLRVYAMVRGGYFPAGVVIRFGRQVRFDSNALELWLAAGGTLGAVTESDGVRAGGES